MDYEKKYKEALEKARQLCAYPTSKPFISDLQDLFPELRESEDEKIRKSLSAYFAKFKPDDMWDADFSFGDILAWLEKQGEQKPAETEKRAKGNDMEIPNSAWSEEDENMLNLTLGLLPYHRQCRNWLKSLRPQNTWKPSDEQIRVLGLAIRHGDIRGTIEARTLVSLFNDLKKLSEE